MRYLILLLIPFIIFIYSFRLDELPTSVHGDESMTALQAMTLKDSGQVFGYGWYDLSFISFWPHTLSMIILGENPVGNRSSAVFFGFLTCAIFYFFLKAHFPKEIVLSSFILFSTSHLWLGLTRFGTSYSQASFFLIGAIHFFWQGLKKRSYFYALVSGMFLAFCFYTYYAARIILPLFIILFLYYVYFSDKKIQIFKLTSVTILVAFLMFLPQIYIMDKTEKLFNRTNSVYVFSESNLKALEISHPDKSLVEILWLQITGTFDTTKGDNSGQYGYRGNLLDDITKTLILVGSLAIILKINFPAFFVLIWCLLALVIGQTLTTAPQPFFLPRFVIGLPAIFIIAAIGLNHLLSHQALRIRSGLTIALVCLIAVLNIHIYFINYPSQAVGDINARGATKIADYVNRQSHKPTSVFLTAPYLYSTSPTLRFLAPNLGAIDLPSSQLSTFFIQPDKKDSELIFILYPHQKNEIKILQTKYPLGEVINFKDVDDADRVIIYKVTKI